MKIITFLRSLFLKNWLVKLVCLLFAGGLWAWVVVQQASERQFEVEINYHEIPEEHVLGENTDREVRVTLRGSKTLINTIEAEDLGVDVNLSGLSSGVERIQILPWHVHNPEGTEVVEINPRSIQVILLERVTKTVEVRPGLTGEKKEGYSYDINVEPDTALVAGPKTKIEDLTELYLTRLDLPKAGEPAIEASVEAVLPRGMELEYPEDNTFFVSLEVHEKRVERVINDVPVKILDTEDTSGLKLEPRVIDVKVEGSSKLLDDLEPTDITATVTLPDDFGKTRLSKINLAVPEGVELTPEARKEKSVLIERVE